MIGNDIDDDFHAVLVRTLNQCFKLGQSVRGVGRHIGVDVVVVFNRIG